MTAHIDNVSALLAKKHNNPKEFTEEQQSKPLKGGEVCEAIQKDAALICAVANKGKKPVKRKDIFEDIFDTPATTTTESYAEKGILGLLSEDA